MIGVRGGYGSAQLLPLLDAGELRRLPPKAFVGYSDLTTLLTFLTLGCGDRVVSRAHAGRQAGQGAGRLRPRVVPPVPVRGRAARQPARRPGSRRCGPGDASGPLVGGTLTQLLASLGTPFAFSPPDGHVLFVDEVGERPYRLDRMLTQLGQSGLLARASAVVFGELPGCDEPGGAPTARDVVADVLREFPGPVLFGFPSGHTTRPALTLPLGVRARARRRPAAAAVNRGGGGVRRVNAGRTRGPVVKRLHLIGICGTAMATLAAMLKAKGFEVRGSDQGVYPPMSDFLAAQGITILEGYRQEHITADLDLVVVGNAVSRGNPEVEEVLDRKIRYCSLPEAVRDHFLWAARSIVVAGTHGKTTTTSLAGWLLVHGGVDPSVLVGGIAENFDSSFRHRRQGATS